LVAREVVLEEAPALPLVAREVVLEEAPTPPLVDREVAMAVQALPSAGLALHSAPQGLLLVLAVLRDLASVLAVLRDLPSAPAALSRASVLEVDTAEEALAWALQELLPQVAPSPVDSVGQAVVLPVVQAASAQAVDSVGQAASAQAVVLPVVQALAGILLLKVGQALRVAPRADSLVSWASNNSSNHKPRHSHNQVASWGECWAEGEILQALLEAHSLHMVSLVNASNVAGMALGRDSSFNSLRKRDNA
jgi:hypothetical protein